MAAGVGLVRGLCEEATCPICLDYFQEPLMIPGCGHNLCKGCLDRYCGSAATGTCPQCRRAFHRGKVGPNRQLANMVEMVRKLSLSGAGGKEKVCEQHLEPKHLFCRDDKTLICVTCERSDHRGHQTLRLEEAAQEYVSQVLHCLATLREEKKKRLERKRDTEGESQELLKQIKAEKEKAVTAFKQLHWFLDEQEKSLLAQMEDTEKQIERGREDCLEKLSKELQSLERIIQEVEEKLQQPAAGLLQDIEKFMESYQEVQLSENAEVTLPAVFKWKVFDLHDISSFLEAVMEQFQDTFVCGLSQQKVNVHLDPDTAHPNLIVSPNSESVRWTESPQEVPDNPERFDCWSCVLGREEFTTGRHFWEVFVGSEEAWSVGVARKTVKRKGDITWSAKGGIWCMGKWGGGYQRSDMNEVLSLTKEPRKIRVTLNCEGGRMAFYDAERATLICEFPKVSFTTEILHPFFSATCKSQLSLAS